MTSTLSQKPEPLVASAIPLETVTNSHLTITNTSLLARRPGTPPPQSPPLRRIGSFRHLAYFIDSSESLSSEHDLYYNAEPIYLASNENVQEYKDWPLPPGGLSPAQYEPEPAQIANNQLEPWPMIDDSQPQSHSRWPMTQLETIKERNSLSSLHTSRTMPRLSMSPQRRPNIIQNKDSIRSIHLKRTPWRHPARLPSVGPRHHRSLSLNDLDCSSPVCLLTEHDHESSSSSGHILDGICQCPARPLQPLYPPPHRVTTPPGIPSFGTREAMDLRLGLRQSDSSSLLGLRRRHAIPRSFSPDSPTESLRSPPMDMLKRMLGFNRPVSSPPGSSIVERVPMPRHVQALARADDGTWVRGAFGSRASGHGVGRRGLERHPYQMATDRGLDPQTSRIEEQVRMIDKACEAPDGPSNSHGTTLVAEPGQNDQNLAAESVTTLPAGIEAPPPSPIQSQRHRIPTPSGTAAQNALPAQPTSLQQYMARYNVIGSGSGHSSRARELPSIGEVVAGGNPAADSGNPSLQNPPPPYIESGPNSPVSGPASLRSDDVAGIREFILHGEREAARQSMARRQAMDEKRQPGVMETCMSWCVSCFSSKDSWCNVRAWRCMDEVNEIRRTDTRDAWRDSSRRNPDPLFSAPLAMRSHAYGQSPRFEGDAVTVHAPHPSLASPSAIAASRAAMSPRERMVYPDPALAAARAAAQGEPQDTRPRRYSNCGVRNGRICSVTLT